MDVTTSERIARHLRSNIVGYLALFSALTLGPAYAATQKAEKNSVVSKSIKKGAVKSSDIGDDQVTGVDVDESSLSGVPGATGGTVTSVGSGAGLTGGPITGSGTLKLTSCPTGQLLKSNGSGYACGADLDSGGDITAVVGGDGLSGGALSGPASLDLDQCADGQVLRSNGTDYACADIGERVFFNTGATPSVAGGVTLLVLNYTSPEVVTNLQDGIQGQIVTIIHGGTNVDINDGGNFVLAGNWNPDDSDTLTLVKSAGSWVELARSAN
jgi:hypothetical protein